MNNFQIFGLQFAVSLFVYALIARWHIGPKLAKMPLERALQPFLLLHATRVLGMTLLVTGVVPRNVPLEFATQAAYGDLLAAGLALLALGALRAEASFAVALVWLFNIWGTFDLLNALYLGTRLDVTSYELGAAWYIPTFIVPALLVTHAMIFGMLLKHRR